MIPYPLLMILATLGAPKIGPELEMNVRGAAMLPSCLVQFNLQVNPEGEFRIGDESEAAGRKAHHPLKIRASASGGTAPTIEFFSEIAQDENFEHSAIGAVFTDIGIFACRKHLKENPQDATAMIRLGKLLDDVGQTDEGGRWIRRATQISPRDWATWHALAEYHQRQFLRSMLSGDVSWRSARIFLGSMATRRLPQDITVYIELDNGQRTELAWNANETAAAVKDHLQQASDCYDWAVHFTPNAIEPYFARFGSKLTMLKLPLNKSECEGAEKFLSASLEVSIAEDARKVAQLSGHPLVYGWCAALAAGAQIEKNRDWQRFWNQAVTRLNGMRREPDAITRADATLALILVRCFAFKDFAGAKALLNELPSDSNRAAVFGLAGLVYYSADGNHDKDDRGMANFLERRLCRRDDALERFVLAECRERLGEVSVALKVVQDALRTFPNDVRLNLLRTGLLLRYGSASDLVEVHLRLSSLEAFYSEHLTANDGSFKWPDGWTEEDQALLRVYCLHRAVYHGLIGNNSAANAFAREAQEFGGDVAAPAEKLRRDMGYLP